MDPATGLDGRADILVKDGKINTISNDIKANNNTQVIDATSKYVIPGLIDCHVHLREPGLEYKETIETGSRAAAKGGFTTLICEPNTNPPIDSLEMVESFMEKSLSERRGKHFLQRHVLPKDYWERNSQILTNWQLINGCGLI